MSLISVVLGLLVLVFSYVHGHDCAVAVLCQNIRGDVKGFYSLKRSFLGACSSYWRWSSVVVVSYGRGYKGGLPPLFKCVLRLFKRTVLRGAFLEGTSLFCVFGYVIITIGYRKVYYGDSILFCLDKALTKSLVYTNTQQPLGIVPRGLGKFFMC